MRRPLATVAALVLLAACGGSGTAGPTVLDHIGRIPGAKSAGVSVDANGAKLTAPSVQGNVLGTKATGNRLLVIGDSILAGTAARYGNEMCNTMVPLGWTTLVEAEAGMPANFGRDVLRARLSEGWDAAVVFLGTNASAPERFTRDMTRIVESLAPRPTLLLTTTLFRPIQQPTNDAIRAIVAAHDNVSLLDWGTASTQPGVLNPDGVHPTIAGRTLLVRAIAAAVGPAPATGKSAYCVDAQFTDDSMGRENMPSTTVAGQSVSPVSTTLPGQTPAQSSSTTSVPATSTTVRSATSTTVPANSTTTTRP